MSMKKLIRGSALSFVFIMMGALVAYLFRRYLALNLSVADYGLFYSIIAFFGLLMLFVDVGMEPSVTKTIIGLRLDKKFDEIRSLSFTVLGLELLLSLIIFCLVFLSADWLAITYFHAPNAGIYIKLLGLWFLLTPLSIFVAYILLGFERTTWYTAVDFFRMTILFGLTAFFFSQGEGLHGVLFAYAAIHVVLFCLYLPYLWSFFPQLFRTKISIDTKQLWEVFSYGFVMAFTAFGWLVITQTDTLVLTYLTSLQSVGLYNVALPLSLFLLFFMRPVTIVYYPHITALATEKKFAALGDAVAAAYKYLFVLLLPFTLVFMVFPEYLIPLLFSIDYVSASTALMILALGTLFYGFSMFNNVIFNGLGKAKYMAIITACVAGLNVVLNFAFIPLWGINGAALSTGFSYCILFGISTYFLRKSVQFSFPLGRWLGAALSGLVSVGLVLFMKQWIVWNNLAEAVVCGGVLVLVYVLLIFGFRIISFMELQSLVKDGLS